MAAVPLRRDRISNYVKNLLSKDGPRVTQPPPVEEPTSDYFLLDFASRATSAKKGEVPEVEEEENETPHTLLHQKDDVLVDIASDNRNKNGELEPSTAQEGSDDISRQRTVVLRNLPFSATEHTVELFCQDYDVTSIGLPTMPDNPLKMAGYALVTFESVAEATTAASALNGALFQGRKIRTRQHLAKRPAAHPSGLQDASRYYVPATEASKRSTSHGMGPKSLQRFPCFLCAAEGHQASDCPDQVCFRCQRSGHQAAQCSPKQWGRLAVCTLCAETSHESADCPTAIASWRMVQGSECLVCRIVHLPTGENSDGLAHRGFACGDFNPASSQNLSEVDESREEGRDTSGMSDRKGGNSKKRRKEAEKSAAAEKVVEVKVVVFCSSCGNAGHTNGLCKFKNSGSQRGGRQGNEILNGNDRKRMRGGESSFGALDNNGRLTNASSQGAQATKCFSCLGFGHISRDCQSSRFGQGRGRSYQASSGAGRGHDRDRSAFLGRFIAAPEGRDSRPASGKGKGRRSS